MPELLPPTPGNGWQPSQIVRTAVWLVRDVGFPIVLSLALLAMLFGWVESPVLRVSVIQALLTEHAASNERFQKEILTALRNQRCLTGITNVTGRTEIIGSAALPDKDPCVVLENFLRLERK